MHLADAFIQSVYIAFKLQFYILSALAFPGNQTHDLGVASAMLYHLSYRNTISYILDENREACNCPIDCQVNNTVKAQKSMKSIVRIVQLHSVVQSEFNEATRTLFLRKESKNNDFIQQFASTASA